MDNLDQRLRELGSEVVADDGFTQRVLTHVPALASRKSGEKRHLILARFFMALALLTLFAKYFLLMQTLIGPVSWNSQEFYRSLGTDLNLQHGAFIFISLTLAAGLTVAILYDGIRKHLLDFNRR